MNDGLYTKIKSSKGDILLKLEFEGKYFFEVLDILQIRDKSFITSYDVELITQILFKGFMSDKVATSSYFSKEITSQGAPVRAKNPYLELPASIAL